MIAWYPLDIAGSAGDYSGNGNDGIAYGTTVTTDHLGNATGALYFDGISSRIDLPSDFDFPERTISLWLKADTFMIGGRWAYSSDHASIVYGQTMIYMESQGGINKLGFGVGSNFYKYENAQTNTWYHAAISIHQNYIKFYVNGIVVDSIANNSFAHSNDGNNFAKIGTTRKNDRFFPGTIDEVKIYNCALSDSEINSLYACNVPLPFVQDDTLNNPGSIMLTASGGAHITWYDSPSGGNILSTDSSFTTPFLYYTTTFYVSNTTSCESGRVPVTVHVTAPISCISAWYKLDNNANDFSGNNYNGTIHGATPTSDRFGNPNSALYFNGTSNYIDLPSDFDYSQRTLSLWLKASVFPTSTSIIYTSDHGGLQYGATTILANQNSGVNEIVHIIGTNGYHYQNVLTNTWYHLAIVVNLNYIKYYINGSPLDSVPRGNLGSSVSGHNTALIGTSRNFDRYFNGAVDDIQIYNCALSNLEINALYNCNAALPIVQNESISNSGSVTLSASGGNSYKWYSVPVGGTVLSYSSNFTTPLLTSTDTFYVSNTTSCESARVPVIVFVTHCLTQAPTVIGASRCGAGSLTLTALGGISYKWYDALNGGNILDTGAVFVTPAISSTRQYFVSNIDSCESVRVPVTAQIIKLIINAGLDTTISCGDQYMMAPMISYNGGNALNFMWSPSAGLSSSNIPTPSVQLNQPTTYTLFVSDSTCVAHDSVKINISPANFGVDFSSNVQLLYNPPFAIQFTNLTPGLSNYNFTWYFGDGATLQSNNSVVFHQYAQNGLYDVTLVAVHKTTYCSETLYRNGWIFCAGGTNCTQTATISQSSPVSGCTGTPLILTCNTVSGGTYQWNFNGVAISNTNSNTYSVNASGNYSVTIIVNSCPVTSNIVTVLLNDPPLTPHITAIGSIAYCGGGSVTLIAPAGFASYLWSDGGLQQSTVVNQSGNYTIQVTDNNGCSSQSDPFLVGASPLESPDICIVSIDSSTNENVIVWDKPVTTAINHFNIYGEQTQANVFNLLGSVPYSSTCVFTDTSSNPAQQAYRYKISAVDTCGSETSLSAYHKTIHLTISQGMGTTWNLIWNYYEGFSFPSYKVYRGTDPANMTLLTTLASTLNSYTDLTPPVGYVYYQIEAVNPNPCTPAKSNYSTTKSNIATNDPGVITSINNFTEQHIIEVYPNPANNQIIISYPEYSLKKNVLCNIYNIDGKLLKSLPVIDITTSVNISELHSGVYILKVSDENEIAVKRIIKY